MQIIILLLNLIVLTSCRTLDPSATKVKVVEKASQGCKNLGVVNVDWAWWGVSSEVLNVMRNQVIELGGNTLVPTGDVIGIAYFCPREETSSLYTKGIYDSRSSKHTLLRL